MATLQRSVGELLRQWREHRRLSQLEVPLRERNVLLLSAGFAPLYAGTAIEAPRICSATQRAAREPPPIGHGAAHRQPG